ncbi:MAG: ribonuclease J [Bacillota bacterium]|nr:ribonuclease J [Bacillota bacterium]
MKNNNKVRLIPLGGMNEIGKNMFVVEYRDDIIIIDCGITFPEESMLGIDVVIPDFSYLKENKKKIKGMVLTHGHEDHIGAIPYFIKEVGNIDIYGRDLTLGLLKNKLQEHKLSDAKLHRVDAGDTIKLGKMEVEFIQTTHSIPQSSAIAIKTPQGNIVHTGDFKVDFTPIDGGPIDLNRLAQYGEEGVELLISDSTNAHRKGYTMSERVVGQTLNNLFAKYSRKRIIVATFASNVHRVQQIISAAEAHERKVALSGRSMITTVKTAQELGLLKIKKDTLIDINEIHKYADHKVTLITTGSQGEPFSALTRISNGDHKKIHVTKNDVVILSASSIPGNELAIGTVINNLMSRGTEVVYEALSEIHVSGHACQEELKLMMSLTKPKYILPFHGEMMQMKAHEKVAQKMGIPDKNILMVENGDVLELDYKGIEVSSSVQAGAVLVDGLGIGDVGNIVLRDRKWLSEDGLIIVVVTLSKKTKKVLSGPDIISRGFVYVRESGDLMDEARGVVSKTLERLEKQGNSDWNHLKTEIKDDLKNYISREIQRKPMILPIIMEV